jgi:Alanine-zipper, major outer membrane lipoprotein
MAPTKRGRWLPVVAIGAVALVTTIVGTAIAGTGPSAFSSASVKTTAKKALKKANKANKTANQAKKKANSAQGKANANAAKFSCPGGTVFVLGGCVETSVRPPATFFAAEGTCNNLKMRLPSLAEGVQATLNGSITPGAGGEWSSQWWDDGGATKAMAYLTGGLTGFSTGGTATSFRCATDPVG